MSLLQPSASLIFKKSHEKVVDLLPSEFDESGGITVDEEDFYLGDGDDWNLPMSVLRVRNEGDVEQRGIEEVLRQRGRCVNELDVAASVTDIDW